MKRTYPVDLQTHTRFSDGTDPDGDLDILGDQTVQGGVNGKRKA